MATVYQNPSLKTAEQGSYTSYREPDTRVPPKAGPVLGEISVNGIAIPENEILAEAQNHPAENPGSAVSEAARALVVRELLWQEARRLEIIAAPVGDGAGRLETEREAAISGLIEDQVNVPSAKEEECKRYYDLHPEKFLSEPLFEARHILLAVPENDAAARAKARERARGLCRHLIENPEDFASLAGEYSDCPSGKQGGNLGQLARGSTVREFERALASMKTGEISAKPVETRFGFHIIVLDRKVPGEHLPFEIVGNRIAGWLEASAWSRAVAQYVGMLAGEAVIKGIDLDATEGPLVQ